MNYFELHIGDYEKKTAHLTAVEDGIYSRLIRRYYDTESPLANDLPAVERLVRARSKEERKAVGDMLREFFNLADDGWHHAHCDEVIARFHESQEGAEEKREHETERKRLYRERRAQLFAQLREVGIVPAFDTTTTELVRMLSRGTGTGQVVGRDADGTATQSPLPTSQVKEQKQQPAPSARFAEFWTAYPVKKGKAEAAKVWRSKGADALADQLLAHVARMLAEDDGWRRGFAPHATTYLRGERWHDEPSGPPAARAASSALAPSRQFQALAGLQTMIEATHEQPELRDDPRLVHGGDS